MSYKLESLFISNFKAFPHTDDPIKIRLSDEEKIFDLFVLAGPNGYGKTSIFQAIELALIGKIEIINIKDSLKKFNENPICNEIDKESIIAVELIDDNGKFLTIIRYNEIVTGTKVEQCCDDYNLYVIKDKFNYNNFKRNLKDLKESNEKDLDYLLGNYKESFWIYYIKQEQTSNFIFQNSNTRISAINNLIDIQKNINTQRIIDTINNKMVEKGEYETKLNNIKNSYSRIQISAIGEKPKNIQVFSNKEFEWDKEFYELDEDFYLYLSIVNSIIYVTKNYKDYDKIYKKRYYEDLIRNDDKIRNMVVYTIYYNNLDEISKYIRGVELLEKICIDRKIQNLDEIDGYILSDLTKFILKEMLRKQNRIENIMTVTDNIYSKLLKTRQLTRDNEEKFIELFNSTCPLCGKEYDSAKELLNSIRTYSDEFGNLNKYMTKEKEELEKEIHDDFERMDKIILELKKSDKYKPQILSLLKSLDNEIIKKQIENEISIFNNNSSESFEGFIQKSFDDEEIEANIRKYLNKKIDSLTICDIENIDNIEYIDWYKVVRKQLNNNFDLTQEELLNLLNNKKRELVWYYNKKQFIGNSDLRKTYQLTLQEYKNILYDLAKLNKIRNVIEVAEKKYKEELIKYIKIPLYIYSGKLLQTHQNGLGVFCDTGKKEDELTKIKFVTNNTSDQDLVTKFSSGQLSILTIASLLAFRKITDTKLKILMIDDPCQTMDELNIASLTEILKNEFEDTQIIISTHEDSIAGYIMYKYFKKNKNYKYFNVKNQLYKIDIQ